jgi:hypothetical protein
LYISVLTARMILSFGQRISQRSMSNLNIVLLYHTKGGLGSMLLSTKRMMKRSIS